MLRLRKSLVPLVAVLMLSSLPGCMGRFALVSSVTKFNLNVVDDRWGREIAFLALYIIPVYPTCGFLDIMLFNSIEFWTEKNPISGEPALVDQ